MLCIWPEYLVSNMNLVAFSDFFFSLFIPSEACASALFVVEEKHRLCVLQCIDISMAALNIVCYLTDILCVMALHINVLLIKHTDY